MVGCTWVVGRDPVRSVPHARASLKRGGATTTPIRGLPWQTPPAFAENWHGPSAQWDRALSRSGASRLCHCVGCSNHIQSANDSNVPWRKTGQVRSYRNEVREKAYTL